MTNPGPAYFNYCAAKKNPARGDEKTVIGRAPRTNLLKIYASFVCRRNLKEERNGQHDENGSGRSVKMMERG